MLTIRITEEALSRLDERAADEGVDSETLASRIVEEATRSRGRVPTEHDVHVVMRSMGEGVLETPQVHAAVERAGYSCHYRTTVNRLKDLERAGFLKRHGQRRGRCWEIIR